MSKVEFHYKRLEAVKNTLSDANKRFLCDLYYRRLITVNDAFLNYYSNDYEALDDFVKADGKELIQKKLIELETFTHRDHSSTHVFYLTSDGVGVVRQLLDLPNNVITSNNVVLERHYWRACNLKPKDYQREKKIWLSQLICEIQRKVNAKWTEHLFFKDYMKIGGGSDGLLQVGGVDIHFHWITKENQIKTLAEKTYVKYIEEYGQYHERETIILFIVNDEKWRLRNLPTLVNAMKDHTHPLIDYKILSPQKAVNFVCDYVATNNIKDKRDKNVVRISTHVRRLGATIVNLSQKAHEQISQHKLYLGAINHQAPCGKHEGAKNLYLISYQMNVSVNTLFDMRTMLQDATNLNYYLQHHNFKIIVVVPKNVFYSGHLASLLKSLHLPHYSDFLFTSIEQLETANVYKDAFYYFTDGELKNGIPN